MGGGQDNGNPAEIVEATECLMSLEERKTGKWVLDNALNNHCSVCKRITTGISSTKPPFCQWCGVKMEVEE